MRREILVGLMIIVSLCACSNTLDNQPGSQSGETSGESYKKISAINSSENAEKQSSAAEDDSTASDLAINWGDYADSLKRFDDHDGRKNNYKDYIMTTQVEMNGKKSKELSLLSDGSTVGSEFLTNFQSMDIVKERQIPPQDETKVTLTVTEAGTPYQYILYESGLIYTVQNEKTYYLGNSTSSFRRYLCTFVVSALDEVTEDQTGVPQLPPLDPWDYDLVADKQGGDSKHKTDFTSDQYDVVVMLTDYGNPFTPILIKDTDAEEKILNALNNTSQVAEKQITSGGGTVIRVFNKAECFNYITIAGQLIDYQTERVYTPPDDLLECLQMSVAYEMACIFEEK